jgi:nucleotidyltransferase/DNA polymerase involved in DNA repair
MKIQFTPNLEIYSIDEAFLNFDGLSGLSPSMEFK